jgi:hypothetical protein
MSKHLSIKKTVDTLLVFLLICTCGGYSVVARQGQPEHLPATGKGRIDFIENKGQWEAAAGYKTDIPGGVAPSL